MRFGEPQTTKVAFARIQQWHEQKTELAACLAAAGGGMHVILQGGIVRLSKARLVLERDTVQLAFNLGGCRFDYGPIDFVVWPGNRMGTRTGCTLSPTALIGSSSPSAVIRLCRYLRNRDSLSNCRKHRLVRELLADGADPTAAANN